MNSSRCPIGLRLPLTEHTPLPETDMKKILGALVLALCAGSAFAAGSAFPLDKAPKRTNDMAALQNGAKLFANYCLSCHAASSVRYNRLQDIGLTEDQIRDNLLFKEGRVGDLMTIAMTPKDAKAWFGAPPPDLSLIARSRATYTTTGPDYLYTFLRTYYRDETKATGWNNLAFPNVGMPHVFWERQGGVEVTQIDMHQGQNGWERVTTVFGADGFRTVTTEAVPNYSGKGESQVRIRPLDPVKAKQYDNDVADLVAFLTWMAEPNAKERQRLGVIVLLFLAGFMVIAWRLNAVFWKDIK